MPKSPQLVSQDPSSLPPPSSTLPSSAIAENPNPNPPLNINPNPNFNLNPIVMIPPPQSIRPSSLCFGPWVPLPSPNTPSQDGVNLLDKRFLPVLDKLGRICHVYLTPHHAMFLHNLLGGDGIQSVARFRKDCLFWDYRISSQNADRIAFAIDVALLHCALRSAVTIQTQAGNDTAAIQITLVKKLPARSHNAAPFLTFETKGLRSAVVQDVPISKPLSRADVLQLQFALDAAQASLLVWNGCYFF